MGIGCRWLPVVLLPSIVMPGVMLRLRMVLRPWMVLRLRMMPRPRMVLRPWMMLLLL